MNATELSTINARPSQLSALAIPVPNKGGLKHSGTRDKMRTSHWSIRTQSPGAASQATSSCDSLNKLIVGRSQSLDFPLGMLLARNGDRNGSVPSPDKSRDCRDDLMGVINRRRLERKLHLADSCTKMPTRADSEPSVGKDRRHSRSKTGGMEHFKTQGLFSVSEQPDDEENGEEKDTPNVIVFQRRRPSMRASIWLDT